MSPRIVLCDWLCLLASAKEIDLSSVKAQSVLTWPHHQEAVQECEHTI